MRRTLAKMLEDRRPVSVRPWAPMSAAIELLSYHNLGALPVLDEDRLIGVISERDLIRKLGNRDPDVVSVGELMTPNPYTVSLGQPIEDCLQLMIDGAFRHLPVMDNGAFIGMISILDIGRAILSNETALVVDLESETETEPA